MSKKAKKQSKIEEFISTNTKELSKKEIKESNEISEFHSRKRKQIDVPWTPKEILTGFDTLKTEGRLNDAVINTIFETLRTNEVDVVHTFLSSYLARKNPHNKKCADKIGTRVSWQTARMILIPIYYQLHWLLCIVDLKEKNLELWDSLAFFDKGKMSKKWANKILPWVQDQHLDIDFSKFSILMFPKVKHQTCSNTCGLFIFYYATKRIAGISAEMLEKDTNCNSTFMENVQRSSVKKIYQSIHKI